MPAKQNRNGHTERMPYKGMVILIRRFVRNDSDKTYSIQVIEEFNNDSYLLKKTFSGVTFAKEQDKLAKAKKWVDDNTPVASL
jgi:16S rRNA U516 pseudouridylate synthase RsuA-like enzyme